MKKAISITMVKDEEKIIESFVRYNNYYFDQMVIIDNGCTDKTMDIVWKLKEEGYPLLVYNESYVDYEQAMIENKYLQKVAKEQDVDWIVPLDADEFFYADSKNIWDELMENNIYYVYWKTYVLQDNDDLNEVCIPKRMQSVIKIKEGKEENSVTKVIVPAKRVESGELYISAGHHTVMGKKNEEMICYLDNVFLAHFPIISKEQMFIKINGSYNNFIPWMTRGTSASHVNQHKIKFEEGEYDIDLLAKGGWVVGIENLENYDIIYDPLNPEVVNTIQMKYTDSVPIDVTDYFIRQAEIFGIKLFNAKKGIGKKNIPKVLIYGTGSGAEHIFDNMEEECVEVLAYIDSNKTN